MNSLAKGCTVTLHQIIIHVFPSETTPQQVFRMYLEDYCFACLIKLYHKLHKAKTSAVVYTVVWSMCHSLLSDEGRMVLEE